MGPLSFDWSTPWLVVAFAASGVVIAVAGTRLAHAADKLSQRTGLGRAIFGAIFLGAATSLPGIVTSVVAAGTGHPDLAVSNAVGGIAAQTVFLVLADVAHRRANLEHAAASLANLANGVLLIALLALPLVALSGPDISVLGVHPASILLVVGYVFGMRMARSIRKEPMWMPRETEETEPEDEEEADEGSSTPTWRIWLVFAALALAVGVAGFVVARTGTRLAERTGLSETAVGVFLTAIVTSLPELVTSVAAVRKGALALAVGDILGGNAFDVLFLAGADFAWREGSIYHAIGDQPSFFIALTMLLTAIVILGLLRRQKHGIANIGFESALVLIFYALGSIQMFM